VLNTFTATLTASADVAGSAPDVYAVIGDPDFISASTPFVRRVVVLAEDLWRWEIAGIRYPGGTFNAALTQRMELDPPHEVAFRHEPQGAEPAGADGALRVVADPDDAGRARLELVVSVHARVPAPGPRHRWWSRRCRLSCT